MSVHFEQLTVKAVQKETRDCVSIVFNVPDTLKKTFSFTQGQYLTLRSKALGDDIRRSYSICSSPLEQILRVAVKKVPGGVFSTYANEVLKKGDVLDVMPPMGKFFTPLDPEQKKKYVAFAAGSGITPVLSIIKTTLQTEPKSSFTLIYGNKNRNAIIFKEELEALKNKYINRFSIIYILSREKTDADIHFGRIDAVKCAALCEKVIDTKDTDAFFLCGPEEMIHAVSNQLQQTGVEKQKIHIELFAATSSGKKIQVHAEQNDSNTPRSQVTVKLDGISFDFELPFSGDAILDAALKKGADLPFACKGGVCCTCKAKLLEGEVDMDVNYGLEPEEIEQGFILTCQSHPRTEKVVVDFDAR